MPPETQPTKNELLQRVFVHNAGERSHPNITVKRGDKLILTKSYPDLLFYEKALRDARDLLAVVNDDVTVTLEIYLNLEQEIFKKTEQQQKENEQFCKRYKAKKFIERIVNIFYGN